MSDTTAPADLGLIQRLVNTLDVETGTDELAAPGGPGRFAAPYGLSLRDDELPRLVTLRESLRAVLLHHAGTEVPDERSAPLTPLLEAAPLVVRVAPGGGAALVPASGLTGLRELTARIAAAIALGQARGEWRRLKACHADDCEWAYYDRSPAGRRRWCSMQVCGSRAKMRNYRSRQRRTTE
ncbi:MULTISPECIES: CGNR zinc finger domain-containing protein [unclassified Streptomyces]|uniref:CGNR zinc finger domain-containing protein n=1 Tax=unclassified Streptomyces TaxID=2593676 RepID=UPI000CD55976|nr:MULTISPECIES: CGNR zinc finger domain-containing protein [unclassified Streptomyces]